MNHANFLLDRHQMPNPAEYSLAVPVTLNDLKYWLAGSPVRVGIWSNHFVALVGYDDTKNRFKFVNSWGDQWGENGFGYVDYSKLNAEIQSAQVYRYKPPKAMPCLRVKFSHSCAGCASLGRRKRYNSLQTDLADRSTPRQQPESLADRDSARRLRVASDGQRIASTSMSTTAVRTAVRAVSSKSSSQATAAST